MSGKSKARREAKAADRAARSNQRAQADLQRRWHLTLKQQREIDSVYAMAAVKRQRAVVAAKARIADALHDQFVRTANTEGVTMEVNNPEVYEPHCVMAWREQMAGMDDMGGIDTALARGDGT